MDGLYFIDIEGRFSYTSFRKKGIPPHDLTLAGFDYHYV
jgi:hypothetical protein